MLWNKRIYRQSNIRKRCLTTTTYLKSNHIFNHFNFFLNRSSPRSTLSHFCNVKMVLARSFCIKWSNFKWPHKISFLDDKISCCPKRTNALSGFRHVRAAHVSPQVDNITCSTIMIYGVIVLLTTLHNWWGMKQLNKILKKK